MAVAMMAASRQDARAVVLVVEDDAHIRGEVCERLKRAGYDVLEADGADEAIALLRKTTIDLVFSDVDMPGSMDGRGLVGWLRREQPHVPALLASGAGLPREGDPPFLAKPYRMSELMRLIRELLAQR